MLVVKGLKQTNAAVAAVSLVFIFHVTLTFLVKLIQAPEHFYSTVNVPPSPTGETTEDPRSIVNGFRMPS